MRGPLGIILCGAALLLAACANAPRDAAPPSQMPADIAAKVQAIGRKIDPPATAPLYAPLARTEPYIGVKVERDIAYGPDARNRLDVFVPDAAAAAPARPVVVFVHGGGFVAGNKHPPGSPFYDNIMLWATENGFVGVNTTYRLAPQHPWPAAQQDIGAALGWVRANIAARGGDVNRIVLVGHSAGATHVALYVANESSYTAPGSGLAGAVMISGLFDPSHEFNNPGVAAYFGSDRLLYAQRSAVSGLAKSTVPTMLVRAELDPPQFHDQFELLRDALCKAGRCPTTLMLKGHSHMSEVYSINTADTVLSDALRAFVSAR